MASVWDVFLITAPEPRSCCAKVIDVPAHAYALWGAEGRGWKCARNPWRAAPTVLFITILTFASAYSHINIGVRHVLVLYPFLALGAAWAFVQAWQSLDRSAGGWPCAGKVLLSAIGAWQVGSLYTAYPDYLPYFNEAICHPEQVLVDSDLDWGQDLHRLEQRLKRTERAQVEPGLSGDC